MYTRNHQDYIVEVTSNMIGSEGAKGREIKKEECKVIDIRGMYFYGVIKMVGR